MLPINILLSDECERSEFEKLYNEYKNEAYYIAYKILDDSALAEDAVADAFLSLAGNFKTVSALDAHKKHGYIIVTIRNSARMIRRKNRHHLDDMEYNDEEYIPHEDINVYDKLWIKECASRLCKADAEILYLKYALELDHKAIARLLGISQTASRKRLQKARQRLSEKLKEGDENG